MESCLFCKIINGDIPSRKAFENENLVAFHDINPAAPVHVLVLPKKHIASLNEVTADDGELLAEIFATAKTLAGQLGIAESGYRVVNNCGTYGGQTVHHIHFHLLGGRAMGWPPG